MPLLLCISANVVLFCLGSPSCSCFRLVLKVGCKVGFRKTKPARIPAYLRRLRMERVIGIEPTSTAWKAVIPADVLYPLLRKILYHTPGGMSRGKPGAF